MENGKRYNYIFKNKLQFQGIQSPLWTSMGTRHTFGPQIDMQTKHSHKTNKSKIVIVTTTTAFKGNEDAINQHLAFFFSSWLY